MKKYFKHIFGSTPSEIRILKVLNISIAIGLCYCVLSLYNYHKRVHQINLLKFNELPDLYAKRMLPFDARSEAIQGHPKYPDKDGDIHGELIKSYFDSIKSLYRIARDVQNKWDDDASSTFIISPFTETENKKIGEILSKLAKSKFEKVLTSAYSKSVRANYDLVKPFLNYCKVQLQQSGKLPTDSKTYLTGLLAFISHVDNGNQPLYDLLDSLLCREIFLDICEIIAKEGLTKEVSDSLIESFEKSKKIRPSLAQIIQAEAQWFHSYHEKVKIKYPIGYFISLKLFGDPIIQAKEFYNNPLLYNDDDWVASINPLLRMHLINIPETKVDISEFLLRENNFIASLEENTK